MKKKEGKKNEQRKRKKDIKQENKNSRDRAPGHDVIELLEQRRVLLLRLELEMLPVARRRDRGRDPARLEVPDESRRAGHRVRFREQNGERLLPPPHELRGADAVFLFEVEGVDEHLPGGQARPPHHLRFQLPREGLPEPRLDLVEDLPLRDGVAMLCV